MKEYKNVHTVEVLYQFNMIQSNKDTEWLEQRLTIKIKLKDYNAKFQDISHRCYNQTS